MDWINTAREIVEQEYERNYLNLDVIQPEEGALAEKEKQKDRVCRIQVLFQSLKSMTTNPDFSDSDQARESVRRITIPRTLA